MKLKMLLLVIPVAIGLTFFACTEKAQSKPNFIFKSAPKTGLAAKFADTEISEQEITAGIEGDLYEQEMKVFEMKMSKLNAVILEKLIAKSSDKKNMTSEEFINKVIAKDIKVTDKEMEAFAKEKNVPKEQMNDQIKGRIKEYLEMDKKRVAVEAWIAKETKGVEVYLQKPKRPFFNVEAGNAPSIGDKDAKVTIIEFSDFQCPFCAKGAKLIHDLKAKYGSKVRIVFRNFPLPFHTNAHRAAEAGACAFEQGADKFWSMHDVMFENQSGLEGDGLIKLADKAKVDSKKLKECLESKRHAADIDKEIEYGNKLGIRSTPTFFVNGQLVNGALPIDQFAQIIDEELAK